MSAEMIRCCLWASARGLVMAGYVMGEAGEVRRGHLLSIKYQFGKLPRDFCVVDSLRDECCSSVEDC